MIDRSIAPEINPISKTIFPKPSIFLSKNQIPITSILLGQQEVFKIEFTIQNSFQTNPLIRQLGDKLLKRGTRQKDAEKIASEFEFYGAFWGIDTYLDYSEIYVYALSKHFKPLLNLCLEILAFNEYSQAELDQVITIQKEKAKLNWEKDDYVAGQLFRETLLKEDPYGKIVRPEDYQNIDKKNTEKYYQKNWHNSLHQIFVSGNLSEDNLTFLNQKIEGFKKQELNTSLIKAPFISEKFHYLEKDNALQTAIRYGFEIIGRNHLDYPTTYLANFILGGYFGSRLQKNIREDKGFTYGIHSQIVNMQRGSYFLIGTSVNKNNRQETLDEIQREIKLLQTELVSEEEFETVKTYLLGNFQGEINSPFDIIEKIKIIKQNNLDSNYYENFQEELLKTKREDILRVMNEYFIPEKAVVQLVG